MCHIAIDDTENLFRLVDTRDCHEKLFLGPMCLNILCGFPVCVFVYFSGSCMTFLQAEIIVTIAFKETILCRNLLCLLHLLLFVKCVLVESEETTIINCNVNVGNFLTLNYLTHL